MQLVIADPKIRRGPSKANRLPVMLYPHSPPSVSRLLQHRGPVTVGGAVIPVVVSPIDREIVSVAVRHRPALKRLVLAPLLRHLNSPATVASPGNVPAAIDHVSPYAVEPGLTYAFGVLDP
jgi:hypothetical protein